MEINNADKDQIDQYTGAFDKLRIVVASLSKPFGMLNNNLNTLSTNIVKNTDALSKLNKQSQQLNSTTEDGAKKVNEFGGTFSTWAGVMKIVKDAIGGVEAALTGMEAAATAGISLLLTFGPAIWDVITSWTKGKEAFDNAKASLGNLNDALSSTDYSNAIEQVSKLKINVGLAKDGLISKNKVVQEYNQSLGHTMGQVQNLNELENRLIKNGPDYIKMTLFKSAAQLALQDAAKKAYEAQQALLKPDEEVLTFWDKVIDVLNHSGGSAGVGAPGATNSGAIADEERKAKANQRRVALQTEADNQSKALLAIAEHFQTEAAEIAKKSGFDFFNGEINIAQVKGSPRKTANPAAEQLKAQSITLAQTVELNKKAYEEEMAVLNRHLEMKIISKEEYQQKSEALQNKYHLAIGTVIKTFQKNELEDTQKHLNDLFIAESELRQGQEAKKKAWTPDQKFDAEKMLLTAKYDMDLANFKGTEAEKIRLAEEKERAITDLTKNYEQQRRDFAMQSAQQVSDAAFSILKNGMQAQSAARLKTLDTQKSAELNNSNLTATQRKAIEDKYKKKEAEEKTRAFKAEQRASILQAVINGALAITKVTSQAGIASPFIIPGIIAQTAIQVATIAAQKPPKYALGGLHYRGDGRGALLSGYSHTDDTNAYLRSGEAVVVSEAMRNPWARNLVSAINVAHGGRDFSTSAYGKGFAVGGIFTDGGNANRYYSQPVHDVKDLANTLAYQMINNFPPIYVDVKDVNNQQNILAQTVNRVNL